MATSARSSVDRGRRSAAYQERYQQEAAAHAHAAFLRSKSPQHPPFDFEAREGSTITVDSEYAASTLDESPRKPKPAHHRIDAESEKFTPRTSTHSEKAPSIVDHLTFRAVKPVRIRVRRIECEAKGKKILKGVDADMAPGTLTAILGSSGSGKVRLMMLCGVIY